MSAMTDYTEERCLKHFCGITSFTMPSSLFVALHTASPGETGASNEVTGGSYARQSATFTWNSGSTRAENSAQLSFTGMPAVTVSHWSIKDASSGGNTLFYGAFSATVTLSTSGGEVRIPSGSLRLTAD
jgi:hypothetical protein